MYPGSLNLLHERGSERDMLYYTGLPQMHLHAIWTAYLSFFHRFDDGPRPEANIDLLSSHVFQDIS